MNDNQNNGISIDQFIDLKIGQVNRVLNELVTVLRQTIADLNKEISDLKARIGD